LSISASPAKATPGLFLGRHGARRSAPRDFDPEDSLPFFALRLHEVGMIQLSPNTLLAEGTDWRFLNELKPEAKGVSYAPSARSRRASYIGT
jgi:hypothetical protein